jgi:hypothetical protein
MMDVLGLKQGSCQLKSGQSGALKNRSCFPPRVAKQRKQNKAMHATQDEKIPRKNALILAGILLVDHTHQQQHDETAQQQQLGARNKDPANQKHS